MILIHGNILWFIVDKGWKSVIINNDILLDLIESQRFGVEYQPIVDVQTNEIVSYEALSRFYTAEGVPIRPDHVYASLHSNPLSLYLVEYAQKKLQINNRPLGVAVFVNLDQDAFFASGQEGEKNAFIQLIKQQQEGSVVVELIENSEINDALLSLAMIEAFSSMGVKTALDDLCNPKSMLSIAVLQLVDVVKLDKYVLSKKGDAKYMSFVRKMINFAHEAKKTVVLEGVETAEDLQFSRALGVDFIQGFYFSSMFKKI